MPKTRKPRPTDIHGRIRLLRERLDLTQFQLGELCEVDKTTVSHWERGECAPSRKVMPLVAKALRTTVGKLYGEAA